MRRADFARQVGKITHQKGFTGTGRSQPKDSWLSCDFVTLPVEYLTSTGDSAILGSGVQSRRRRFGWSQMWLSERSRDGAMEKCWI